MSKSLSKEKQAGLFHAIDFHVFLSARSMRALIHLAFFWFVFVGPLLIFEIQQSK